MDEAAREVKDSPIWCDHCDYLEDTFIRYEFPKDSGVYYCSSCALINKWISQDEMERDIYENIVFAIEWHDKQLKRLHARLKELDAIS